MTVFTGTLENGNTWAVDVCNPNYVEVFVGTERDQKRLTYTDYADSEATADLTDDAAALQEFWTSVTPMADADFLDQSPESAPLLAQCFPADIAAQVLAWHAQHEDEDRDDDADPVLLDAAKAYAEAQTQ